MARKSKDLFVVLAERYKGKHLEPKARKEAPADIGFGATISRWWQGAVRSLRGTQPPPPRRPKRSSSMHRVPRGLLIPGWLLVSMLTFSLGCGVVVGHFTSGFTLGESLDTAERPGSFRDKGARRASERSAVGIFSPTEEEETLHKYYYPVQAFHLDERSEAALLAVNLRSHGVEKARIRAFRRKDGSIAAWVTLCYVAAWADQKSDLARLQELESSLGFVVKPGLKEL